MCSLLLLPDSQTWTDDLRLIGLMEAPLLASSLTLLAPMKIDDENETHFEAKSEWLAAGRLGVKSLQDFEICEVGYEKTVSPFGPI